MSYRATVGLSLPVDEAETARLLEAKERGQPIPMEDRRMVFVEAGEIVPYVPEISLPWLLDNGCIVEEEGDD